MDRTEDQSLKRSGFSLLMLIILVAGSSATCFRENNAGTEQSEATAEHRSIHQAHLSRFDSLEIRTEEEWDCLHGIVRNGRDPVRRNQEFKVFGWHPYYMGSSTKYTISDTLGGTAQLWFDDGETLGTKYDWVKQKGLAGIGIWALGYDNGHTELWEVLEEKFGQ